MVTLLAPRAVARGVDSVPPSTSSGGRRVLRPGSARLALVCSLGLAACDSGPTEPAVEPNVTVLMGAAVTTTDDAVLVAGQPRIQLGGSPRGIYVQHSVRYSYTGAYEYVNDELWNESWYMDVGRTLRTPRADTIFYRSLDFGDVALEETPADRFVVDTLRVYDTPDGVRVYQRTIVNRVGIYSVRVNTDGSTVTFRHAPFYERMIGGGALRLTASGSEEVAPVSTSVTLRPGARVERFWNGEDLHFERERPILRTDEHLVIELSRPLDADRALLRLFYIPPPGVEVGAELLDRARAVFELDRTTDRVVIPASALADVASHLAEGEENAFILRASEYISTDDVMELVQLETGTVESLSSIQINHFTIYVRVQR